MKRRALPSSAQERRGSARPHGLRSLFPLFLGPSERVTPPIPLTGKETVTMNQCACGWEFPTNVAAIDAETHEPLQTSSYVLLKCGRCHTGHAFMTAEMRAKLEATKVLLPEGEGR